MSYYHVLLKIGDQRKKKVIHKDLNEKELKKGFVKRFLKKKDHLYENEIIKHSEITQINILETPKKHKEEMVKIRQDYEQMRDRMARKGAIIMGSITDDDIEKSGTDVTRNFISNAPDGEEYWLLKLIKHPLFVAIVTFLLTWYFLSE